MRRIFVGDIHGCREPLERLLSAVSFAKGRDRLLPVGDLVNKGPDSEGTVRLLMDLGAEPVIGNHDLEWLARGKARDPRQREWLSSLPPVRVFDDVILVHAGLHPRWTENHLRALPPADVGFAVSVRYCAADGQKPDEDWPPPGPPFRPWDDFYRGAKRVVFGHWARRGLVVRKRCLGLDTGCLYGGPLTAWIAEEDRIVQVDGSRDRR